MGKWMYSSMHS